MPASLEQAALYINLDINTDIKTLKSLHQEKRRRRRKKKGKKMSAYVMLAEQSPLAPTFTTADAVTVPASFDDNISNNNNDFLDLNFADNWTLPPSFTKIDPRIDSSATHLRNGQPTPPLDDSSFFMANSNANANTWDDTPTPPSSDDRAVDYSAGKRRRLRGSHKSSVSSSIDSDDQGGRGKREKFLERNRLAASKCRQKKKEHTTQLESRFKEASEKRELLNAEISRLRSEVLGLKNEVLRHAQCGDEPIKLHLAHMVKQIASKDRDDRHPPHLPAAAAAAAAAAEADGGADSVSFGFDDPLPNISNESLGGDSLEQQIRRDSEVSMALSADDDFNNLINV